MKEGGAAKGELVLAMYELANSFRHGWGVEKDPVAARSYYETAANLGDTDAMNEVARCYEEGFGGKKDKVSASPLFFFFCGFFILLLFLLLSHPLEDVGRSPLRFFFFPGIGDKCFWGRNREVRNRRKDSKTRGESLTRSLFFFPSLVFFFFKAKKDWVTTVTISHVSQIYLLI